MLATTVSLSACLALILPAWGSTASQAPLSLTGPTGQAVQSSFDRNDHIDEMRKDGIPVRHGMDEARAPWILVRATIPSNDKNPHEKAWASASAQVAESLSAEVSTWTESSYSEAGGAGPDGEGLALLGETLLMFNTDWK